MTRLGGIVGGLAIASTVFFGFGELLARGLGIVDRLNGYTRHLYVAGPSPDLPYRLRPGVETRYLGTDVRINAHGLRGPAIADRPRPGVRRVLVLGDSVVFGQGVAEDETVSAALAARLGAGWEVINAGTLGWNTVAEAAYLETQGLALGPSVVVLGVSLNDYDDTPRYDPLGILVRELPPTRAWLDRSEFFLVLRWLVAWSRGGLWQQIMGTLADAPAAGDGFAALVEPAHRAFYAAPDAARWLRAVGALERVAKVARDHDVAVVAAVFPERYQVGVVDVDRRPQGRWREACANAGIPLIDLEPLFTAAGGDLFADVQHPNARGHAVAADAITAWLAASGS